MKLFILGFITPLLEEMNIPVVGKEIEFDVKYEAHLDWTGFLMESTYIITKTDREKKTTLHTSHEPLTPH